MADWSDHENDVLVAAYMSMLLAELAREPYTKAKINRDLQAVTGRSRGAIEYKLQNVSAVLLGLGHAWIPGYKPAQKFQGALVLAVMRGLSAFTSKMPSLTANPDFEIALPPGEVDRDFESRAAESYMRVCKVVDMAAIEARNRKLGKFGEGLVFEAERRGLKAKGRTDLAAKVRWVARDEGDGHGYDVASFTSEGEARLLEVKSTAGWAYAPFHLTENERRVAISKALNWRIIRVWDAARAAKAFEISVPLDQVVNLSPTAYLARFSDTKLFRV